jgi:hypothetical protein
VLDSENKMFWTRLFERIGVAAAIRRTVAGKGGETLTVRQIPHLQRPVGGGRDGALPVSRYCHGGDRK